MTYFISTIGFCTSDVGRIQGWQKMAKPKDKSAYSTRGPLSNVREMGRMAMEELEEDMQFFYISDAADAKVAMLMYGGTEIGRLDRV